MVVNAFLSVVIDVRKPDQRESRRGEPTMAHHGKIQLTFIIAAPPDLVAEG